jgi:hypothetical protein
MAEMPRNVDSAYLNDIAAGIEAMEDVIECIDDYTTVRDQFAMAALQGIVANGGGESSSTGQTFDARQAYGYADAMLATREAVL